MASGEKLLGGADNAITSALFQKEMEGYKHH